MQNMEFIIGSPVTKKRSTGNGNQYEYMEEDNRLKQNKISEKKIPYEDLFFNDMLSDKYEQ